MRAHPLASLLLLTVLPSCGSDSAAQPAPASVEAGADAASEQAGSDTYVPEEDAAVTVRCTLDSGADPVGFCLQKAVLSLVHSAGVLGDAGTCESVDWLTHKPDTNGSGQVLHAVRDDIAIAAALAHYHYSAGIYGDNELTPAFDADLVKLSKVVQAEQLPDGYDGELYLGLRVMSGGLRYLQEDTEAANIDALADAYARSISDKYFHALALQGDQDAGAGDAEASDSGEAGAAPSVGVLGIEDGGQIVYRPDQAAAGALALLDMAWRKAAGEPQNALLWQARAAGVLQYVMARAREPSTGMLYRELAVSSDQGHDAAREVDGQPADTLLSDVQAATALALVRAERLASEHSTELTVMQGLTPLAWVTEITNSMNGTPTLWDAKLGGYMTGYVPSTTQVLTDKPTRANSMMLSVLHGALLAGPGAWAEQINPLRSIVMALTPEHTSLMSAMAGQEAYFLAVPSDFNLDDPDAGTGARARSYYMAAIADALDGLHEQWTGWGR